MIYVYINVLFDYFRFCDVDNDGEFDVDDVDEADDDANDQTVELRTLSPGDLSGAFILLFLGLTFALAICIAEVIFEQLTREKRDSVRIIYIFSYINLHIICPLH